MSVGDLIVDFLRFLWGRTSERATIVVIGMAAWMNAKDCREMADYFKSFAESLEKK